MNTPSSLPAPAERPTAHPGREPDAPQTARPRRQRQPPPADADDPIGHFASFTVASRLELEIHVVGATGVGSDGQAAGGSRWRQSGWQLRERHPGTTCIIAGQQGSFSALSAVLDLLRIMPDPARLAATIRAAGLPCIVEDQRHV